MHSMKKKVNTKASTLTKSPPIKQTSLPMKTPLPWPSTHYRQDNYHLTLQYANYFFFRKQWTYSLSKPGRLDISLQTQKGYMAKKRIMCNQIWFFSFCFASWLFSLLISIFILWFFFFREGALVRCTYVCLMCMHSGINQFMRMILIILMILICKKTKTKQIGLCIICFQSVFFDQLSVLVNKHLLFMNC